MSFSSKVKSELCQHFGNGRHCNISELASIVNICGHIEEKNKGFWIKIQSENFDIAKKCFTLIKKTFNIEVEITVRRNSHSKNSRMYFLCINNTKQSEEILKAVGILHIENGKRVLKRSIPNNIISKSCCKRSYIRGSFLALGSITDPEKTYHLEFVGTDLYYIESLKELISFFDIGMKIVERKGYYVLYLKEGELIVDLLNVMGAHVALMDFENVRILKDMRNNLNRIVNCETANLGKIIAASVKQIEDINYIMKNSDFSKLPDSLIEVAKLRVEYPDASLKELSQMMDPPVGKSGVNHRLKKLGIMADELRREKGDIWWWKKL